MKSILLVSHGSKAPKAREEIDALARQLKRKSCIAIVQPAFMEIESPNIPEGIRQCVKKSATEIIILLNFLNSGRHASADIPKIVRQARKDHPGVKFRMTKPVGQEDYLVDIFLKLLDDTTDVV